MINLQILWQVLSAIHNYILQMITLLCNIVVGQYDISSVIEIIADLGVLYTNITLLLRKATEAESAVRKSNLDIWRTITFQEVK